MAAGKTSDDEIDILIQRAIKIAEKVPEQYRLKAFEVVLSNLLVYPIFGKKERRAGARKS